MVLHTKEITSEMLRREKVYIYSMMTPLIMVIGQKIKWREKVNTNGMMVAVILDNGKIISNKEKEFIHGLMVENMKVNMKMIKNMDLVSTNGLIKRDIKETGLTANNTVKESILKMAKQKLVYGIMVRGLRGLQIIS